MVPGDFNNEYIKRKHAPSIYFTRVRDKVGHLGLSSNPTHFMTDEQDPRPAQAGEVARVVHDAVVQPAPGAVPDAPEQVAANIPAQVDEVFLEYMFWSFLWVAQCPLDVISLYYWIGLFV